MNIRTDIICSECDVDLKDKLVMGETMEPRKTIVDIKTKEQLDEKTLADLIKNAQIPSASIVGISSANFTGISEESLRIINTPYPVTREVLKNDWIIANKKIEQSILEGNIEGYISVCSCVKTEVHTIVLCEISKTVYSDGSYKIHYNPLTINTIKRMPE